MSQALIDAARLALRAWDITPQQLVLVSRCENTVFRVDTVDGSYVLRLHRPGYQSLDALVSEQTWTKALRAAGIAAPVSVPTADGAPLGHVHLDGCKQHVGLLEWVDGEIMLNAMGANQLAAFERLGELLASLHNQAVAWEIPSGFTRDRAGAEGLMGEQPVWGRFWEAPMLSASQSTLLCELRSRIYRILRDYGESPGSFSLIHSDLHPGNVIVSGDSLHVIDFDDASFGWHMYDIAIALKQYTGHHQFCEFRSALLRGYRRHRPLTDSQVEQLPLFILVRTLTAIGWVAGRPDLDLRDYHEQLITDVEAKASLLL